MGNLTIYTGPMKSGKTSNLIKAYKHYMEIGEKVIMVKPNIDDRFAQNKVVSRDSDAVEAINVKSLDEILLVGQPYNVICIDEFQLLSGNICTIKQLLDDGKNILVSGLNLTAEKKPFGLMGDLMCFANTIHVFKANCDVCGNANAIYTKCKIEKQGDIMVGEDIYESVCSDCYKGSKSRE